MREKNLVNAMAQEVAIAASKFAVQMEILCKWNGIFRYNQLTGTEKVE